MHLYGLSGFRCSVQGSFGLPVEGLRGLRPPTANCLHQSFIDHASKVMVVTTRKIVVTMGAMMAGLLAVLTLHSDSC